LFVKFHGIGTGSVQALLEGLSRRDSAVFGRR